MSPAPQKPGKLRLLAPGAEVGGAEEEPCQDLVGGLGPWHSGHKAMSEEAGPKGSDAWSLEQSGLRGWGERSGPQRGVSALWAGRGFRKLRAEVGRAPSGRSAFVGSLSGEPLWVRGRSCA